MQPARPRNSNLQKPAGRGKLNLAARAAANGRCVRKRRFTLFCKLMSRKELLFLMAGVSTVNYFGRTAMAAAGPDIARQYLFREVKLGQIFSAFRRSNHRGDPDFIALRN